MTKEEKLCDFFSRVMQLHGADCYLLLRLVHGRIQLVAAADSIDSLGSVIELKHSSSYIG